jgi:hypothetical protein
MSRKSKKRFYLIQSVKRKRNFGAFPFSPKGHQDAEDARTRLEEEFKEALIVIEK